MISKRPQIAKQSLGIKSNTRGIVIPGSLIYYRVIFVKSIWFWHKNRHVDKQDKAENANMSTQNYSHLIFDNDGKKHILQRR